MRILRLLTGLILAGASSMTVQGEIIQDYTYTFDEELDTSNPAFHPLGWFHSKDNSWSTPSVYVWTADGGRTGGCLEGTQSPTGWSEYNDLLITPPITGNSSIYIKLKEEGGSVSFFSIGDRYSYDDQKFYCDKLSADIPALIVGEWVKVDLPVQDNARVGIRLDKVYADDFYAESCDVTAYQNLVIESAKLLSSYQVAGDAENRFEVNYEITLNNKGDLTYTPGDENYTFSHYIYKNSSEMFIEGSVADTEIPEELAPGETKKMNVTVTVTVTDEPFAAYDFKVKENVTGNETRISTLTYTPYVPEIKLFNPESEAEYITTGNRWSGPYIPHLTFGAVYDDAMRQTTVAVKNVAPKAPVTITGIYATDNFTIEGFTAPVTIEAGESAEVTLKFDTDVPGVYMGELTVSTEELPEMKAYLSAAVPDNEKWHEGFEEGTVPAGFLASGEWMFEDMPADYSSENHTKTLFAEYSTANIVTPLLTVAEGESLLIAGYAHRYQDMSLTVSYSPDRMNWTQVYSTYDADVCNKFSIDLNGDQTCKLRSFITVDNVPAGDWYLKLEGSRMLIDEIYGFTAAPAGKDLYLRSSAIAEGGKVNYPFGAEATVLNLGVPVSADDYTVTLYLNDEILATAETVDLAAGEEHVFTLSGVPHADGEFDAYIEVKIDDNSIMTSAVTVNISEEKDSETFIVGPTDDYSVHGPVLRDKSCISESIYSSATIKEYGSALTAGATISTLTYYGQYTSYYGSVDAFDAQITVYMKNTTDVTLTADPSSSGWYTYYQFSDPDEMTKVFEGTVTINPCEGGELFTITLDERFVYDGESIVIQVRSETDNTYSYDTVRYSGKYRYDAGWSADSDSSPYPASGAESSYLPSVGFGIVSDVATVSGTVTHSKTGLPIEDVDVAVESDDNVVYRTKSDADGAYTLRVFQPQKQYKVKASKEEHQDYESAEYLDLSELAATHDISMNPSITSIDSAMEGSLKVTAVNGGIVISSDSPADVVVTDMLGRVVATDTNFLGEKKLSLAPGIYIVNRVKVTVK